jgi:hypothetical protein
MKNKRRAADPNGSDNIQPGAYKLRGASQYLGGLSKPTMYRLIQRRLLHPNRVLRHLIFSREELDRFLREGMR